MLAAASAADNKRHADAASDMVRFAAEFGMTAAARSRLVAGIHGQPGPSKFELG